MDQKSFRRIVAAIAVASVAVESPCDTPGTIDGHQRKFDLEVQKIEDGYLAALALIPLRYQSMLNDLARKFQRDGDIDAWLAVNKELSRFKTDVRVAETNLVLKPEPLRLLQVGYRRWTDSAALDRARAILTLSQQYRSALQECVVEFTRQGRMAEALRAKDLAESVPESELVRNANADLDTLAAALSDESPNGRVPQPTVAHGNVALATRGAFARAPNNPAALNDGNQAQTLTPASTAYGPCPCDFIIDLPRTYSLQQIRTVLPQGEHRRYRYKILTSVDGRTWDVVADRTRTFLTGTQDAIFPARRAKMLKICGIEALRDYPFQIVEVEAYCVPLSSQSDAVRPPKRWPGGKLEKPDRGTIPLGGRH